ncbi:hypothetical protein ACH5RR_020783 [Cinchona calisaya]|uniref:Uncharacterized protein n=1 Tax=Cinchona calisaya TaxID=153742 RepID=A0ABD2ZGG3_9GENT
MVELGVRGKGDESRIEWEEDGLVGKGNRAGRKGWWDWERMARIGSGRKRMAFGMKRGKGCEARLGWREERVVFFAADDSQVSSLNKLNWLPDLEDNDAGPTVAAA